MSGILPLAEIQERFVGQWVLLGDIQTNDVGEVLAGRVLCHSNQREEVDAYALRLRPARFALLYVGIPPGPSDIMLFESTLGGSLPSKGTGPRYGQGRVGWLVALGLAALLYLETANTPLSIAAVCVKAGWSELCSGW